MHCKNNWPIDSAIMPCLRQVKAWQQRSYSSLVIIIKDDHDDHREKKGIEWNCTHFVVRIENHSLVSLVFGSFLLLLSRCWWRWLQSSHDTYSLEMSEGQVTMFSFTSVTALFKRVSTESRSRDERTLLLFHEPVSSCSWTVHRTMHLSSQCDLWSNRTEGHASQGSD